MNMTKFDRPRRPNRSAMRFSVSAGALVAVLVLAGCGDDDDNEMSAEFTDDGCHYSGPTEFEVGDEFDITVSDVTEERMDVGFAVLKVPDGTSLADVREPRTLESVATEDERAALLFAAVTEEGTERMLSGTLDIAGTWVLNWFVFNPDGDFPATTFEVVEES